MIHDADIINNENKDCQKAEAYESAHKRMKLINDEKLDK